jgi:hypothetical protein
LSQTGLAALVKPAWQILRLATRDVEARIFPSNTKHYEELSACAGSGRELFDFSARMDFHFKPTELLLWSIACAVFGWLLKSHFSGGCELRKQNFRAAIASIRDQFSLVRDESLVDAHAQSLPRIREECSKIRNDVGRRKWEALNLVMTTYSGLTKNDIENRDLGQKGAAGSNNVAPANYPLGRSRLSELLAEMAKQAE